METVLAPEALHTARLALRSAEPADAVSLHAGYFGSEAASRFLGRSRHDDAEQTRALLERMCVLAWRHPAASCAWVVADRRHGEPVGIVYAFAKRHAVEIHYGICVGCSGQGFATEAVGAVTDWLLSRPSIQRVGTAVAVEHLASRRVLEKLGFHQEGVLRAWAVLPAFGASARDAVSYSRLKVANGR